MRNKRKTQYQRPKLHRDREFLASRLSTSSIGGLFIWISTIVHAYPYIVCMHFKFVVYEPPKLITYRRDRSVCAVRSSVLTERST
jgi:hypothetical protein